MARRGGAERGRDAALLEHGADPNDGETPYHAPEGYDNTVVELLLKSGRLDERSKAWMLARKADWHDDEGMKLVLDHGAIRTLCRIGGTALCNMR